MKKIFTQLLFLVLPLAASLPLSAHDFEAINDDGIAIYYNITSSEDLTCAVSYRGENYASYDNEYTGSVVIPSCVEHDGKKYAVTAIGSHAFRSCPGLISVDIPESVVWVGDHAFSNCSSLKSVTIPASVTEIGESAFAYCTSLTHIYALPTTPPTCEWFALEGIDKSRCTLYVPEAAITAYQTAEPWNSFLLIEASNSLVDVTSPLASQAARGKTFNLQGIEVNGGARGIVIKDGRKMMIK